jgi:hypothetical protein
LTDPSSLPTKADSLWWSPSWCCTSGATGFPMNPLNSLASIVQVLNYDPFASPLAVGDGQRRRRARPRSTARMNPPSVSA